MDNKKRSLLTSTLVATALIGGTGLNANSGSLFSFNELGSGSVIRTTLATKAVSGEHNALRLELKCGNEAKTKEAESKSTDAKCGEGKCGGDSKDKGTKDSKKSKNKKAETKSGTKSEDKLKDAKCGEGKCGN